MKRRVCLIVDHPARDLDGLVLLARELARGGAEAFLVPMYRREEVFVLRPDVVLVNYARYANAAFLRGCREAGIVVGVLDTEGGVMQDVEGFAGRVREYLEPVDFYGTWGRLQAEALARGINGRPLLRVTGCPRYDYAVEPWVGAVPEVELPPGPMVLVNTNFPIVNPRFQSPEQEIRDLVERMGYDREFILEFVRQARRARDEVTEATLELARRFPQATFVLRPHPFENPGFYEQAAADRPNVRVIQEGSIFEWIKPARAVLHHNCATAIESFLMGREPISLTWIDTPLLTQPTPTAVSQRPASLEEAARLVERLLSGEAVEVPEETARRREEVVGDYFHARDGGAARRVAALVLESVPAGSPAGVRGGRARYLARVAGSQGGVRRLQLLAAVLLGAGLQQSLKRLLRRGSVSPAKRFRSREVQSLLDRLARVDPGPRVSAQAGRRSHAAIPTAGAIVSVRISAS